MGSELAEAESILREIAVELGRLPMDERVGPIHLRALALKRVVSDWSKNAPSVEHAASVLESLRLTRAQVHDVRATSHVRLSSIDRASFRKLKVR